MDPIRNGCAQTVLHSVVTAPQGVETALFAGGITIPLNATYLVVHMETIVGDADVYTYFQPTGGALAALGAPHPLGGVTTATNDNPPTAGAPYYYWILPSPGAGVAYVNVAGHAGTGATTVTASGGWCTNQTGPYCPYGSRPKAALAFVQYLTPGLIDVALGELGEPWLAPLFTAWWFTAFDPASICNVGPPPLPTVTPATFSDSLAVIYEVLANVLWPHFCECTPGSPNPPTYPPPVIVEPPGWPGAPVFTCNNADLCSMLQQIMASNAALQAALAVVSEAVTLIQRQAVPFAYIASTAHAGLTGAGNLEVSGLLGIRIDVTTGPSAGGSSGTTPAELYDVGFVTWGCDDGYDSSFRVTHPTQVSLPPRASAFTDVAYDLAPGTVITITELVREP